MTMNSEDVCLRRWCVETAMQAHRDNVPGAREDVQAYAEKLLAWVSGQVTMPATRPFFVSGYTATGVPISGQAFPTG